ncbi:unnamed protein product [Symbiodinium microadriaticum]|nr:unnamed protein product [Symbiodinium microadriaticum]
MFLFMDQQEADAVDVGEAAEWGVVAVAAVEVAVAVEVAAVGPCLRAVVPCLPAAAAHVAATCPLSAQKWA